MSMGRMLRKADLCKTGLYQYAISPPKGPISAMTYVMSLSEMYTEP